MTSLRRYLEQLMELGERELVLERGGQRPVPAPREAARAAAAPTKAPAVASVATAAAQPADAAPKAGRPAATPVPHGITVEPPASSADLFTTDPIAALPDLAAVAAMIAQCTKCGLAHTRQHTVPGEGDPRAGLVVVGEAPGATEDETGRPFVGRAGQLLNDILKAIGFAREQVFIMNVLKCRPPNNRDPEPLEAAACSPYLHRQIALIGPRVILAMGRPAGNTLLATNSSLADLRGKVHSYRGVPLIVTYHPAALLRNPNWKRPTWDDVRLARRIYDGETV